jgi:exodeoxyribonuclease V beta subunit
MSAVIQTLDIQSFQFRGLQVIEASAGTGKTWTLAMLYLRLLLGDGPDNKPLRPPEILVMTFTEAATQELRDRIRIRIGQAVLVFRDVPSPDGKPHDKDLLKLRRSRPEAEWLANAQRLEAAGQWMDEAAIHTIHGWCSRTLRQHAFDSVSLFEQEHVEDRKALLQEVIRDYWRRVFYAGATDFRKLPGKVPSTPDELLEGIQPLLAALGRKPTKEAEFEAWWQRFDAADTQARSAWRIAVDDIEAVLAKAVGTALNGRSYPPTKHAERMSAMRAWSEGAPLDQDEIGRYAQNILESRTNNNRTVPEHPAFLTIQSLIASSQSPPLGKDLLLAHVACEIRKLLAERKARFALFDFDDLLQRLYTALHDPKRGTALAASLRRLYPVALVDEFQDTDPWQYGALSRIYGEADPAAASLVMIGDPKQAIYRFRGADLNTYLAARDRAAGQHSLAGNYRSTKGLVDAVNHLFRQEVRAFGADIDYAPVQARREDITPLSGPDEHVFRAMTVWHAPETGPQPAAKVRDAMAQGFATQIVSLLNQRVMVPSDVAVLVRTGKDARLIRDALARRGVRSVYLSDRDSVYATDEARDLWYILRAVAEPRSVGAVRAALSTLVFDLPLEDLDQLFDDEVRYEAMAERFAAWQQVWAQQGLLAMLYAVLHEQRIPARLLADKDEGERRLTNLLHLGDLLQKASQQLQGEAAVVRFLAEQLRDRPQEEGAAQLRLETDAELVKVVTMHKSKGLQYPVVFVPFAYEFIPPRGKDLDGTDDLRVAEDLRLLYVAFTRAERALFVGAATRGDDFVWADRAQTHYRSKAALSRLLRRSAPDDLLAQLDDWKRCDQILVEPLPTDNLDRYLADEQATVRHDALEPSRQHRSRWRSSSFTALTRGLAHPAGGVLPTPPSEVDERFAKSQLDALGDEPAPDAEPLPTAAAVVGRYQDLGGGARFGDLLHGLLEWQLAAGWPAAAEGSIDPADEAAWSALVARRAGPLGLAAADQGRLKDWIRDLARCPLGASPVAGADPLPSLAGLVGAWPEMGFVLPTQGVSVGEVDRLLRAHIQPGAPRESLTADELQGQLTGFLDLVFESGGRYYVLDYKSNRLPDYHPARLAEAVLASRYELQYALYLLALHRLLKSRLPGYDYDCHIGGAIYVFARGIDTESKGIHRDCPPRALIEALDRLFAGRAAA